MIKKLISIGFDTIELNTPRNIIKWLSVPPILKQEEFFTESYSQGMEEKVFGKSDIFKGSYICLR